MTRCTTSELTAAPHFGKSVGYTPAAKMETLKRSFRLRRLRNILCASFVNRSWHSCIRVDRFLARHQPSWISFW